VVAASAFDVTIEVAVSEIIGDAARGAHHDRTGQKDADQ